MSTSLTLETQILDNKVDVKVSGQIDEVKDGKAPAKEVDGQELEFDAIEAQYFNFLKQQG